MFRQVNFYSLPKPKGVADLNNENNPFEKLRLLKGQLFSSHFDQDIYEIRCFYVDISETSRSESKPISSVTTDSMMMMTTPDSITFV
jgi:hypothetical protein